MIRKSMPSGHDPMGGYRFSLATNAKRLRGDHAQTKRWSGMRLGWGHDDGAFFFSRPDAAQQECCEPGSTLLCMGLFSRFFVQALPCTAEGTLCRVRDTRSLVPRAYGTNRSNSNTSCASCAA